jgi:ribosome biogenesis GTPase A
MLLINKSDFLSPELVAHWNAYFKERGIKHLFFSALIE